MAQTFNNISDFINNNPELFFNFFALALIIVLLHELTIEFLYNLFNRKEERNIYIIKNVYNEIEFITHSKIKAFDYYKLNKNTVTCCLYDMKYQKIKNIYFSLQELEDTFIINKIKKWFKKHFKLSRDKNE